MKAKIPKNIAKVMDKATIAAVGGAAAAATSALMGTASSSKGGPEHELIELALPQARVALHRKSENEEWTPCEASLREGVLYHGNVDLKDQMGTSLTLGRFELARGVTAVMGPAESGKTALLQQLEQAAQVAALTHRVILHSEPLEAKRLGDRWRMSEGDEDYLDQLADFIVKSQDEVVMVDSMSAQSFQSWSGWSTAKFGLNPGLFFWLTQLHNVLVRFNKVGVVTFNPGLDDEKALNALFQFLKGRVAGVIHCQGFTGNALKGVYTWRRADGTRPTIDLYSAVGQLGLNGFYGPSQMIAPSEENDQPVF